MGDARLDGTTIADSVIDLIGNTPLVRMKRISELEQIPSVLAMKMETSNPGGSSKDRPALEMIVAAERDGLLRPGGTIVEPTSGNTGVGLAIVAAQRGYRCVFVMTDKVAPEKVRLLQGVRRRGRRLSGRRRAGGPAELLLRGRPAHRRARRLPAQPVRQPGQPARPREDDRPGAVDADGRADHPLRRRGRHVRHDHRHRPLPEGAEPRHPDRRRRPGGLGVLRRLGPPLPRRRRRRGLLPRRVGAATSTTR